MPWHTDRTRIAELGGGLAVAAGVVEKIGRDVALLAQTEVGEASEPAGGVSSTMPQKRNPVRSTVAVACARRVYGYASVLMAGVGQEHERGVGGWHAEWAALSGALAMTGAAAAAAAELIGGLDVHPGRMRANLDAAGGAVMAEAAALRLGDRLGRQEAREAVADAAARSAAGGGTLVDELAGAAGLEAQELARALAPESYLGSAGTFVDRAVERYRRELAR